MWRLMGRHGAGCAVFVIREDNQGGGESSRSEAHEVGVGNESDQVS